MPDEQLDETQSSAGGETAAEPEDTESDGGHGEDVGSASESELLGDDEPDGEVAAPPVTAVRSPGHRPASEANLQHVGMLHVYARERTFSLPLDGDSALRIASAFQRATRAGGDDLDARTSSAAAAWAVIDLSEVLGMLWMPGLPSAGDERIAIDPVIG